MPVSSSAAGGSRSTRARAAGEKRFPLAAGGKVHPARQGERFGKAHGLQRRLERRALLVPVVSGRRGEEHEIVLYAACAEQRVPPKLPERGLRAVFPAVEHHNGEIPGDAEPPERFPRSARQGASLGAELREGERAEIFHGCGALARLHAPDRGGRIRHGKAGGFLEHLPRAPRGSIRITRDAERSGDLARSPIQQGNARGDIRLILPAGIRPERPFATAGGELPEIGGKLCFL